MRNYLKKINNAIDFFENISNNIIMRKEDLEWMRVNGLFTDDQIKMIQDKKAFPSNQIPDNWEILNWKLGE